MKNIYVRIVFYFILFHFMSCHNDAGAYPSIWGLRQGNTLYSWPVLFLLYVISFYFIILSLYNYL